MSRLMEAGVQIQLSSPFRSMLALSGPGGTHPPREGPSALLRLPTNSNTYPPSQTHLMCNQRAGHPGPGDMPPLINHHNHETT